MNSNQGAGQEKSWVEKEVVGCRRDAELGLARVDGPVSHGPSSLIDGLLHAAQRRLNKRLNNAVGRRREGWTERREEEKMGRSKEEKEREKRGGSSRPMRGEKKIIYSIPVQINFS